MAALLIPAENSRKTFLAMLKFNNNNNNHMDFYLLAPNSQKSDFK